MEPLFNRALYRQRLTRHQPHKLDALARFVAAELAERLSLITRSFNHALLISDDAEIIRPILEQSGKVAHLTVMPSPEDEDMQLASQSYDAIFNMLDLHIANDVPGRLAQMRRALLPDGLFLACLPANLTLNELRQAWLIAETQETGGVTPRVAPMIDVRELGSLLQRAQFALPVVDIDRTIIRYRDALALIHEIHALGFANLLVGRSRTPVSRRLLGAAVDTYHQLFSDADGRIRATIELAWAIAWAPHPGQPKPLAPGSAKQRLADALQVPEIKLEKD